MSNLRELSENIKDTKLCGLEHMISGSSLDMDMAKTEVERIAAEALVKDARKQGKDEKYQINRLKSCFPKLVKQQNGSLIIMRGNFVNSKIAEPLYPDTDCLLNDNKWKIVFTLKGGQKEKGGAQNKQFDELMHAIQNAPLLNDGLKHILVVYICGELWNVSENTYRRWDNRYTAPFTRTQLLKWEAADKKCIVLTDNDLPNEPSSFYDLYIKGTKFDV